MSNSAVGGIYKRIIDAVVEVSRTDFEENGVSSDVLLELQQKWQEKLSQTQRANFPWEPQAEQTRSKNEPIVSPISSQPNPLPVKQEPFNDSFLTLPQPAPYASGLSTPHLAQQRAAQLMQQQFGQQANNSIGALHAAGGMSIPAAQPRPANAQVPRSQPQAQPQVQPNGHSGAYKQEVSTPAGLEFAQTDGAGDAEEQWDAVIMQRNAHGDHEPTGRIAVDGMIRRHVEAMAQRLEGGGLMVPLEERRPTVPTALPTPSQSRPRPFGGDAAEDDDEIGSDLDDPEDVLDDNIEAAYDGDVILCLYDKVQRVKNKWKCTLKDGVVTVDGKDYVFHKAQGEFEW